MTVKSIKEAFELFNDNNTLVFEKWPNKYSNILNELNTIKLVSITFRQGRIYVTVKNKKILELAVKEHASKIILFDNSSDRNCYEDLNRHWVSRDWLVRELYVFKKGNKYNAILQNIDGETKLATPFYVDNICIIAYKHHPCYPQDTLFGLKFLVGKKFCFLRTETGRLSKSLFELTNLTELGYRRWHIYQGNVRTSHDGTYYQKFAGWEETWLLPPKKYWVTDKIYYEQELTSSAEYWNVGIDKNLKPCPTMEFYRVSERFPYLEHIGFAYDSKEKINTYPLNNPFLWAEYEKYREELYISLSPKEKQMTNENKNDE